jgi:hypothetical protein
MHNMSTFKGDFPYEELPSGDTFRYLTLQSGVGDEPLVSSLHTANILDTEYDAVSYIWGTSIKDHTILCDGYTMMITPNLSEVLRRVRLPDRPLVVWADSICINQQDVFEKGHQVALMGKIYRSAQKVFIYLGSDEQIQGPTVCSLLDEVDQMIQATCKMIVMDWDSFPSPNPDDPLLFDDRWNALHTLISQNWFDRGWVVQEAALARSGEVIWGQSRFEWEKLMRVYIWLSKRGAEIFYNKGFSDIPINAHTNVYLDGHQDFAKVFYGDLSWGTPSLLKALNCAKELDVTNPCDRIYAFMELSQHTEKRIKVHPNYSASHLDAYKRFAIEYIRSTKDTELLDYVSHNDKSLEGIPSWVPRWDIETWSLAQASAASSTLRPHTSSSSEPLVNESGSLRVSGVLIDTIQYASGLFEWETTTSETIHQIWRDMTAARVQTPYTERDSTESTLLLAFLDSLSACTYDGDHSQWRLALESFSVEFSMNQQPQTASDQISGSANAGAGAEDDRNIFFDFIRNKIHNRRFILTGRGYMGLAPLPVRESDMVGIIFGCKTPCILRKTDQEKHYKYLGATAILGKECSDLEGGGVMYCNMLGEEESKDWVDWGVEEEDFWLC